MNLHPFRILASIAVALQLAVAQTPFTEGNLVAIRVGSGAGALTNAATPVFLDEYSRTGTLVRSVALPTVTAGRTAACTLSGTATSEGHLNLSTDGSYLSLAGYSAALGTANPGSLTVTNAARVVARVDMGGNVDTTTLLTNTFSSGTVRSAITEDGVNFWVCGSNSGVQLTQFGGFTATAASTGTPTNLRSLVVYNGQLFASSASGTSFGISTVGTGMPTTAEAITLAPGFPNVAGPSPYDFFFVGPDTCYLCDDRSSATGGGIQKWTRAGGVWSLAYTLSPSNTSVRSISGSVDAGVVTLYATSTTTSGNAILSVVDAGPTSTFSTVATAPTNTVLRGIRFLRPRGRVVTSGVGSPSSNSLVPTIAATAVPSIGNAAFALTSTNCPPFTLAAVIIKVGALTNGYGLLGAPPGCLLYVALPEDILAGAFTDVAGNAQYSLPLPNDPFFVGLRVGAQWLAVDYALPYTIPVASSQGLEFVIGS
jgi:hypothetical protein